MKQYTFDKGKHRSTPAFWGLVNESGLSGHFNFSDDCIYTPQDAENDTNKLVGFSLSWIWWGKLKPGHHYYSYRLGWRPVGNLIELSHYAYINGVRHIKPIGLVDTDTTYEFILEWKSGSVAVMIMRLKNRLILARRVFPIAPDGPGLQPCYKLGPYFGGNKPAPHYMPLLLEIYKD